MTWHSLEVMQSTRIISRSSGSFSSYVKVWKQVSGGCHMSTIGSHATTPAFYCSDAFSILPFSATWIFPWNRTFSCSASVNGFREICDFGPSSSSLSLSPYSKTGSAYVSLTRHISTQSRMLGQHRMKQLSSYCVSPAEYRLQPRRLRPLSKVSRGRKDSRYARTRRDMKLVMSFRQVTTFGSVE